MQIVTGYRGEAHITSNDDQGRNQGTFGESSYVLSVGSKFAATIASVNEIQIADGEACMQGVHFRVDPGTYDSVAISNGTAGMNRKDLIVCRYTKDGTTGVETCAWTVIEGTPSSGTATRPSAVSGDILGGDLTADMAFYEVVLSGVNVTAVNALFSTLLSMKELQTLITTAGTNINKMLQTSSSLSVTGGAFGHITAAGASAQIYIPIGKSLANYSSVTCTALTLSMRLVEGGYLGGSGSYNALSEVQACAIRQNCIYVVLTSATTWGTNNTPIVGSIDSASFTLS